MKKKIIQVIKVWYGEKKQPPEKMVPEAAFPLMATWDQVQESKPHKLMLKCFNHENNTRTAWYSICSFWNQFSNSYQQHWD